MEYMRHDAIIVQAFRSKEIKLAHAKAVELGLTVTEIIESPINGYVNFMIASDGSKEGWDESNLGNTRREAWMAWAREARSLKGVKGHRDLAGHLGTGTKDYDDVLYVTWVHVQFAGDDEDDTKVVDHNYKDLPEDDR